MEKKIARYDIPRVQANLPGNQTRLGNGALKISPGAAEPVLFALGNRDGVPLSLVGFSVRFVAWQFDGAIDGEYNEFSSTAIIDKELPVDNPHSGEIEMLLSGEDTRKLNQDYSGNLYWSLLLVNKDDEIFPLQVTNTGERYGIIHLDSMRAFPLSELIK